MDIGEAYKRLRSDIEKPIVLQAVPTHFSLTIRLRRALNNPDTSVRDIANIVKAEPAIAAAVVRSANSASIYTGGVIHDVERAVGKVGLATVRRVALAIAEQQLSKSKDLMAFASISRVLWLNSLYTASVAEVVADKLTAFPASVAQFKGLVAPLGAFYTLYLASKYPEIKGDQEQLPAVITKHYRGLTSRLLEYLEFDAEFTGCYSDSFTPELLVYPPKTWRDLISIATHLSSVEYAWDDNGKEVGELTQIYTDLDHSIKATFLRLQEDFQ